MKQVIIILTLLSFIYAPRAFADDKIYTNADLSRYSRATDLPFRPSMQLSGFNPSFEQLQQYIEEKLSKIRVPEYQIYLHRLAAGMSQQQVRTLWGTRVKGGVHEGKADKTWEYDVINYEIGVALYFLNDQLKGWQTYNPPHYTATQNSKIISYKDLMRAQGKALEGNGQKIKEIPIANYDEEVVISIAGCVTLQDSLDGKKEGSGAATFALLRHGRTIAQICDEVGQGCKSCKEIFHQAQTKR